MSKDNKDNAPGSGDVENDNATAKSMGVDEAQETMDEETEQG